MDGRELRNQSLFFTLSYLVAHTPFHAPHPSSLHFLHRILNPPLIPEQHQLPHRLIQWHNLAALLTRLIIPIPPVHSAVRLLLRTHDDDVIVQRQLRGADLLLHGVAADVDVGVDVLLAQYGLHFFDVVDCAGHDGDDHDLAWGEPEGPAAGEVFG